VSEKPIKTDLRFGEARASAPESVRRLGASDLDRALGDRPGLVLGLAAVLVTLDWSRSASAWPC
jgi:hypothetical protein